MKRLTENTKAVLTLSPKIKILPIQHGSSDVAQEIREFLLSMHVDCLAVPLPLSVEIFAEEGIQRLPSISLIVLPEPNQQEECRQSFIPVDPCQAVIMALRVAMGEGIDRAYIDRDVHVYESVAFPIPDPYAVKHVSYSAFASGLMPFMPYPKPDSQRWHRITWMAFKLHELELEYSSIICLCTMEDWPWLREAYQRRSPYSAPDLGVPSPFLCSVNPSHLYFALCELPFFTELFEKRRSAAQSDQHLSLDGIKELLVETRIRWQMKRSPILFQERNWVTPQLLQMYLQYVRNLALLENRLTPDLYSLVVAAKQMAGDDYAITLLETAKSYVYQDFDENYGRLPVYNVGINQLESPDGEIAHAKNRLQCSLKAWRTISLQPSPPQRKKKQWAYRWNPNGQCSWPPEDNRIEGFTAHVRDQANAALGEDLARVDKFTTSFNDGIDLRETLRHWRPQGGKKIREIFVKDIPPSRGTVEIVVFLFEVPANPKKFSWQTTWYAEHENESTLSFFATPFLENMTGPGIGQSLYGGALFLFPPIDSQHLG